MADGTTIAYDVAGDGPPAVFVHGMTSFRASWEPVTARLQDALRCVRIDLRGHGASSRASDYSTVSLVGDVKAVVDKLELKRPALIGHSLGATIVAVYAALHEAGAVTCVDPPSLRFGDFATLVQRHAAALNGENTMETVISIDHELQLEPYADIDAMEHRIRNFPREVVLGSWEALLTTPPGQLTATAETLLSRIAAPLLSLHGSPPPADYEAWLTRLVPAAQVEVWEERGHMLHLVEPERFARRLRSQLAAGQRG